MQLVFMNQMSRNGGPQLSESAQVWIGEEEGVWRLGWRSMELDGDSAGNEDWYEGVSWQELLCVYRHGLAGKLADGYRPVIEGVFHDTEEGSGKNQTALRLQCYSERYGSEELYTELCSWRRKKAAAGRKAPYFIASNRVLRMISAFVPQTLDELLQLPGIGNAKASEHGAEWLEITAGLPRQAGFPLDWVHEKLGNDEFMSWLYKQKEQKYKQELDKFRIGRTMLMGIAEGLTLDELAGKTGLTRRELVEQLEVLEKEGYDTDRLVQAELAHVPDAEQSAVRKALEELGGSFLKPVLQRAYGEEAAEGKDTEQLYERIRLIRICCSKQPFAQQSAG